MAKLLNWSKTKGPYPGGSTWEKIAKDMGPRMFACGVFAKIEPNKCDWSLCQGPCSPDYRFCSKKCADEQQADHDSEARAEAEGS